MADLNSKADFIRARSDEHAVCCYKNPLVQEALKQINITPPPMDFYKDMKGFLKMRLEWKK